MRNPRLLSLCFPTYGKANELHFNSRGDSVVLAPDEFHLLLRERGWDVDVVSIGPLSEKPLFRSKLLLRNLADVDLRSYSVFWHMFRDPTQPEVLEILQSLQLNYFDKPVINHVERLKNHDKHRYSKVLFDAGLGPEIVAVPGPRSDWQQEESCRVRPDRTLIETYAYNNNRGDYPELRKDSIVLRYVDNAVDGLRSMVRFGYAFGSGFTGFRYYSQRLAFKSGGAERSEPFEVPESQRARIRDVLQLLGIDVCHIDAIPIGDELLIIDINPYPTSNGNSLSAITEVLVDQFVQQFPPAA